MSAVLPLWAVGKHITSVLLVPQTVNTTTGAMTDTTPTRQFFGHMQDIEVDLTTTMENISAMDRSYENNVPIEDAATVTFTEIEKSAGTNLAAAAAFQARYWKYTIIRGVSSFIGYGVFEKYVMSGTKPRVTSQFILKMIDVGTDNISYS